MSLIAASVITLSLGACEKQGETTQTPDPTADPATADKPAEGEHGEGEHGEGKDHEHAFEGGVQSFHEVLAPLWHAEPGDERTANTCAAMADLTAKAQAVADEPTPTAASDEDTWKARAADMITASQALTAICEGDQSEFDAGFEALHVTFHALIEVIGQGH